MKKKILNYSLLMSRMTLKQIFYRIIKIIKFKLIYPKLGRIIYRFPKKNQNQEQYNNVKSFFNWNDFREFTTKNKDNSELLKIADKVCENEFTFLNITQQFKDNSIKWSNNNNQDKLWQYYLNYFEYLLILIEAYYITDNNKYINKAQKLIENWIDSTEPGQENAWEAYTISIRLVYWSYLWEVLKHDRMQIYDGFSEKLIGSVEQQAKFLYFNLEKDLANNHYTANGKALFWIGVTFPNLKNSERYLQRGVKILHDQLLKEVRNDGSQYENSTSYQLMTAKDYIEILIYAEKNGIKLPEEFYKATEGMFDYILKFLKPDKTLPLLNDSAKGYPIYANELLALAAVYFHNNKFKFGSSLNNPINVIKMLGKEEYKKYVEMNESKPSYMSVLLEASNYIVLRNGWNKNATYLLFDAGEIGPKHNAGHAHADNLSIFLHAYGEDIFVDPGTYEYEAGYRRDYYRSTRAHNTLEIEGQNQSTFWGPFRVGHIAESELIQFERTPKSEKISASHNGYRRLKQKITHKRDVEWDKKNNFIIKDSVHGKGSTHGKIYYQIGKNCKDITLLENSCILEFQNSIIKMKFSSSDEINIDLEDAYISEKWKEEVKTKKIAVSFRDSMPIQVTTSLTILKKE